MLFEKNKLYVENSYSKYIKSTNESLIEVRNSLSLKQNFDIFLSHSYDDRDYILKLVLILKTYGYSVYVDWMIDKTLSRDNVNENTAKTIKRRMKQSKCLIYATSENAYNSKWMPWELGYFDGFKDKVAILPIANAHKEEYVGQEYLSLYPYIDEAPIKGQSDNILWINYKNSKSIKFDFWLNS